MSDPIDMDVDVLRDFCEFNFSLDIAKVMSIWMSKVAQNLTVFKK